MNFFCKLPKSKFSKSIIQYSFVKFQCPSEYTYDLSHCIKLTSLEATNLSFVIFSVPAATEYHYPYIGKT